MPALLGIPDRVVSATALVILPVPVRQKEVKITHSMRMWMVVPKYMCDRHLLGEHVECHMFAGCIDKNKPLSGYIKKNLFDAASLVARHDSLAREMKSRGFRHQSPLNGYKGPSTPIDSESSLRDLLGRCPQCRDRFKKYSVVSGYRIRRKGR